MAILEIPPEVGKIKERIELLHPLPGWYHDYARVECGTRSPKNIWSVFYVYMLEIEDHYILMQERKVHFAFGQNESERKKREKALEIIGIAHTKEEAKKRLEERCRDEIKVLKQDYYPKQRIAVYDHLGNSLNCYVLE
ncbi:hypothetical protein HYT51_02005 [Candidatus Woesearchaeota archaeon]|nr:hypothetical protein [Candidatus Woesearchaeota archaeon]